MSVLGLSPTPPFLTQRSEDDQAQIYLWIARDSAHNFLLMRRVDTKARAVIDGLIKGNTEVRGIIWSAMAKVASRVNHAEREMLGCERRTNDWQIRLNERAEMVCQHDLLSVMNEIQAIYPLQGADNLENTMLRLLVALVKSDHKPLNCALSDYAHILTLNTVHYYNLLGAIEQLETRAKTEADEEQKAQVLKRRSALDDEWVSFRGKEEYYPFAERKDSALDYLQLLLTRIGDRIQRIRDGKSGCLDEYERCESVLMEDKRRVQDADWEGCKERAESARNTLCQIARECQRKGELPDDIAFTPQIASLIAASISRYPYRCYDDLHCAYPVFPSICDAQEKYKAARLEQEQCRARNEPQLNKKAQLGITEDKYQELLKHNLPLRAAELIELRTAQRSEVDPITWNNPFSQVFTRLVGLANCQARCSEEERAMLYIELKDDRKYAVIRNACMLLCQLERDPFIEGGLFTEEDFLSTASLVKKMGNMLYPSEDSLEYSVFEATLEKLIHIGITEGYRPDGEDCVELRSNLLGENGSSLQLLVLLTKLHERMTEQGYSPEDREGFITRIENVLSWTAEPVEAIEGALPSPAEERMERIDNFRVTDRLFQALFTRGQ